jgi:hypothetical protein
MPTIRKKWPKVRQLRTGGYLVDLRRREGEAVRVALARGRTRLQFPSKALALAEAERFAKALVTYGTDRLNAVSNSADLPGLGQLAEQLRVRGKTLVDAGRHDLAYLQNVDEIDQSKTVAELLDMWIAYINIKTDKTEDRRERTITSLVSKANILREQFGEDKTQMIDERAIRAWLNGVNVSQRTRHHYVAGLKQFFNWCIEPVLQGRHQHHHHAPVNPPPQKPHRGEGACRLRQPSTSQQKLSRQISPVGASSGPPRGLRR